MLAYITLISVGLVQICSISGIKQKPTYDVVEVRLSYFAGMPNPRWELKDEEITKLMVNAKAAGLFGLPEQMPSRLGYSGLLVRDKTTRITELLVGADSFDLQMKLIKTMPDYAKIIKAEDESDIESDAKNLKFGTPRRKRYAPQYDDDEWDGDKFYDRRRFCNSNYNYVNERATNTYAMPGFASGIDLLAFPAVTLANIQNAALADGMVLGAGAAVPPPPAAVIAPPANENHLVLIRYRPATPTRAPDYVFLREDSDRFWSYKPGLGLVTSIDTAGAIIQDPRVATMGAFTGVSQFLRTNKLTIDIGGDMICPF